MINPNLQNTNKTQDHRSKMKRVFILDGGRTPFGKFGGSFVDETIVDLSSSVCRSLLARQKLQPDQVGQVILGNVCPSTTDTLYGARHIALKIGAPVSTPGYNINRLCGSGLQAIIDVYQIIQSDPTNSSHHCYLAGGSEHMSQIPHLTYGARFGTKYGSLKSVDMLLDALTDQYAQTPMGITAENIAQEVSINRDESDLFSFQSHEKAKKAIENNELKDEIIFYETKRGKKIERDEHVRFDANLEELKRLKPNFKKDGVVTPGSASGIVDGAAFSIVSSLSFLEKNQINFKQTLGEILDYSVVGVDPKVMGLGPVTAIREILTNNNLSIKDIDLFEINEAFAPQVLGCAKQLEINLSQLNIWGGAIAYGHPLGASGTRVAMTLCRQLKKYNKKLGIASLCIGGGMGIAMLIQNSDFS